MDEPVSLKRRLTSRSVATMLQVTDETSAGVVAAGAASGFELAAGRVDLHLMRQQASDDFASRDLYRVRGVEFVQRAAVQQAQAAHLDAHVLALVFIGEHQSQSAAARRAIQLTPRSPTWLRPSDSINLTRTVLSSGTPGTAGLRRVRWSWRGWKRGTQSPPAAGKPIPNRESPWRHG